MEIMNKNILDNQGITLEEKNIKLKIFDYFYFIINNKNKTSLFTLYLFHFLETIQIISYAFSFPHSMTWKISLKSFRILNIITSSTRLSPIFQFLPLRVYTIFLILTFIIVFVFFILLIVQINFRKTNSKIYNNLVSFTHITIAPLTIFLYTPITEFLLVSLKCSDKPINETYVSQAFKCYSGIHYFIIVIGIILSIVFFFYLIFLNFFYFYPFQSGLSTIKLNSTIDIILLIIKLILIIKYIFINNEYFSIIIFLILSLILLYQEFSSPIYNINSLEIFLNLRNVVIFWTFCMLFVAQICINTKINNLIYLLIFGYPIIIFSFIMIYRVNQNKFYFQNSNVKNINICLSRIRFLMKLINSFIEEHKNNLRYNENINLKNDILLKGFIQIHTETCLKEECPLTKFVKNDGNFNIQKHCLLNYMTIFFNNLIKKFPFSIILRLYYIYFNFSKKYNLNSVRLNLEEIKKMRSNINEEFILYCLEQDILKMKLKDNNDGNEEEIESILIEQNYNKLKELIVNSVKLYVEFWGIFATNITNNINTLKLYKLGEKLNVYLKEINYLWENNLKNKKIEKENENNAQLYSLFLREILWDQKKSEMIQKKINDEHNGYNKIIKEKNKLENLDNILENQDYVIYLNSDEKGKCNIIQFSNSLTYLIGYQKQEVLNKPIEFLMPSIFISGHQKEVEKFIQNHHFQKNSDSNRTEKFNNFILMKSKIGYLVPFNSNYLIYDDNDFSNSFIIKVKLEPRDSKSTYAYYILTKPDFSVESISSSALHLGLTMDLLKKYVIKLNILVRNNKDNLLNLFDRYKEYEEDPKKVIWVYPNIIYPKNEVERKKEIPIQDLIKISKKNKFNMQIFEKKYKEEEIVAFIFKFSEIKKKNKNQISPNDLKPMYKNEIMFDLLNLNYIRTVLVDKKSGLRNLRNKDDDVYESRNNLTLNTLEKRRKKLTRENLEQISSDEEEKQEIKLTKERILELQTRDSKGIKSFINILPFYGNEISLIKHRPNKEKYPAGKAQEPLIKIDVSNYTKRIDARIRENPAFFKRFKNRQKDERNNPSEENNIIHTNFISSVKKQNENINQKREEEINKNIIDGNSFSLINVFNLKSIKYVKYVDFFIYIFTIGITIVEFILSYNFFIDNMKRFSYLSNSYKLLSNLVFIKYFINEAIFSNTIPGYQLYSLNGKRNNISYIKGELANYREDLSNILSEFTSANIKFSKEYIDYIYNKNLTIKSLSNGIEKNDEQSFFSAMNKLTTSLFYISTISDNSQISMNNTYSYELMVNLLNAYYIAFERLIMINLNDFLEKSKKSSVKNLAVLLVSFFFSFIYLIIFWKMMSKLESDREKPINLFLTIKKKVFEDLKNSAENFSNKLLNKYFGVDENEEESQQEYRTNVKASDINIAKFKALNEFKSSKKQNSFFHYFVNLIIFYILYLIYSFFKYLNAKYYYKNMSRFSVVYNSTQFSQIYLITRVDIVKQYFFNSSIINYNVGEENMIFNFLQCFINITDQLEDTIKETSKTKSFLKNDYRNLFEKYMYNNFSEILIKSLFINEQDAYNKAKYGFKSIYFEIIEILRTLISNYFMEIEFNPSIINTTSELLKDQNWFIINDLILNFLRPWYGFINAAMNSSYYLIVFDKYTKYIISFLISLLIISIYYLIIWKRYKNEFIKSIYKSFDLINLMPEEIKNIIVNKLNE